MKAVDGRIFKRGNRQQIEREIDEELRFHLECLTEEHLPRALSLDEATAAALRRFGNVQQCKDQCLEISSSGHPLIRALRAFLIPVFLVGVLVRVFSTELHVMQFGDSLMFVAVLGRLFLYVRGLNPSSFRDKVAPSSPLMLIDKSQIAIAPYDRRKLTPVERVISDE